MRSKSLFQRAAAAAVCLLLGVLCLSQPALAYEDIPDLEELCTLRLEYAHPDVLFDFYRVAVVSKDVQFTPVRDFADYPVQYTGLDRDGWRKLATTLAGYVEADGLGWLRSEKTDEEGKLKVEDLPAGLYLVVGHRYQVPGEDGEAVYYQPAPFLICLPNWVVDPADTAGNSGTWATDVAVRPKYEVSDQPTVFRRVLKSWEDRGYESRRPEEIRVQLLKDGVVEEEVVLSRENHWFYDWPQLDNRHKWTVREVLDEDHKENYTVTVSLDSVTFHVENTYDSGGEDPGNDPDDKPPKEPDRPVPPRPPKEPDKPTPPQPNIPPVEIEDPEVPLVPPPEEEAPPEELLPPDSDQDVPPDLWMIEDEDVPLAFLPQTGQLWWPVPILALVGLVMFVIGWARNRRARADEE